MINLHVPTDGQHPLYELNAHNIKTVFDTYAAQFELEISEQEFQEWYEINEPDFLLYNQELVELAKTYPKSLKVYDKGIATEVSLDWSWAWIENQKNAL